LRTPIFMTLYLVGIVLAVSLVRLLRATLFKGEAEPFVMELPPYRVPTVRGILLHTWERGWLFLRKAGTIIVAFSVVLWALVSYPKVPKDELSGLDSKTARSIELSRSIAGQIGHGIERVMRPVGFDWKASTALIGAFAAKELFVSQLGIVHAVGEADEKSESLRAVLQKQYTPLQAFCIMLFCLISMPCVATVVTMWKESGSWRWAVLQLFGLTALAYVVTLIVYQGGRLIGSIT